MRSSFPLLAVTLLLLLGATAVADDHVPAPGPAEIRSLVQRLAADKDENGPATTALAAIGLPAVAPLRLALMDAAPGVRAAAARALGRIGATAGPALPSLVAALEDDDGPTRAEAARAIERVGWPDGPTLGTLAAKTEDPDDNVRRVAFPAAILAGRLDKAETARLLSEHETRAVASRALSSLGARAIPLLSGLLGADAWEARAEAAKRLAALRGAAKPAAPALAKAMSDESGAVASAAAVALYATEDGSDAARAAFLALAVSQDPVSRASAVLVLSERRFESPEATAAIDKAASDPNAHVRLAAAVAAISAGRAGEGALGECVAAVGRAGVPPPYPVPNAHRNLTGAGSGLPTSEDTDGLPALKAAGGEAAIPVVEKAFHREKGPVRRTLLRALWHFVPAGAPPLVAALSDADPDVRLEAALCLSASPDGEAEAVPVLVDRLRHPEGTPAGTVGADQGGREAVRIAVVAFGEASADALASELDGLRKDVAAPAGAHLPVAEVLDLLGRLGASAKPALPALERAEEDPGLTTSRGKVEALLAGLR